MGIGDVVKTVWKMIIPITDEYKFEWPGGSVPLTVQMQYGELCLWFWCNTSNPVEERTVLVVGTGNPAPNLDYDEVTYLGTAQHEVHHQTFMWHVFLKKASWERWPQEFDEGGEG